MAIYISGSLAYDRVMTFPGTFSEYILPDKIHRLNVCFLIDHLEEKRGGTGGNIAYNLALLGERSSILACVGKDFGPYRIYLESIGVNTAGIRTLPNEFTAGAYITTDKQSNQITAFHAAAMNFPCQYSFAGATGTTSTIGTAGLDPQKDIAIIAPSNPEDMAEHARLYQQKGLRYIFDPGQQITSLSSEALVNGISGAAMLVSNDYELELICKITGLDLPGLLSRTPVVITTLSESGSRINRADGTVTRVGVAPVSVAQDPTGAGDAYRAGLLKGLLAGLSLEQSACLGAACASFCVEKHGTQEHYFDQHSLGLRFEPAFGQKLPLTFTSHINKDA